MDLTVKGLGPFQTLEILEDNVCHRVWIIEEIWKTSKDEIGTDQAVFKPNPSSASPAISVEERRV
jgi:hypothetical protein